MTYNELIRQYRDGQLEGDALREVESDIERHEAISEYLLDREEQDDAALAQAFAMEDRTASGSGDNPAASPEAAFAARINAQIRKTFIRSGLAVGGCVIVIMLFVLFVLPQWVNRFYYNPAAVVGTGQYGTETNRGSLDMAVYTELFIPDGYRDKMLAESDGYGEYSVYVPQTFSCNGRFTDTVGKITRGKLTLYNPNLLKRPSVNHFVVSMSDFHSDFIGTGAAGSRSDAFAALRELGAEDWYTAYVTFDRVMDYSQLSEWSSQNGLNTNWCAVCVQRDGQWETLDMGHIGLLYGTSASELAFDGKKYPYLTSFSLSETTDEDRQWLVEGSYMTQHMASMLRYMADHRDLRKMMELDGTDSHYAELAQEVETQGLHFYGCTVTGRKSDLVRLSDVPYVAYVSTTPLV